MPVPTVRLLIHAAAVVLVVLAAPARAADAAGAVDPAVVQRITAGLTASRADLVVESVVPAAMPGLLAVRVKGGFELFASADGRYLLTGDLIAITEGGLENLSEQARDSARAARMAEVPVSDMIVFAPPGERRAVLNVFTDVDCGYCQKLHLEMAELNRYGIEVRYLAYPRAGVGSPSYDKIVAAWCADDRQAALTRLKAGDSIEMKTCANPVASEFALGQEVGVRGTPALVLEDGRMLPGYLPAEQLAEVLGLL